MNPDHASDPDRRGRPRRRARDADEVAHAQGPPRAVRPPDARLRPRRGARGDGRPPARRLLAADRGDRRALRRRADFALQDEPRGTGDALRAALAALPAGRDRDPRPERRRAAGRGRRCWPSSSTSTAPTGAALLAGERRDARARQARPGRPRRRRRGRADRRGQGRDRRRARDRRGERRHLRLRRRLAPAPDRRPRAVAGDRRAVPDRAGGASPAADGRPVASVEVDDDGSLAGINDRAQLADATYRLRERINRGHLAGRGDDARPVHGLRRRRGGPRARRGPRAERHPRGAGPGSGRARGSAAAASSSTRVVGATATIWASVLESSEVEDEVRIGPFAHLRPGSSIGRGAKLGNYAEVKNSRLEAGVQQHHMSYLGDAHVGERTNIGAGTITANYDGTRKHRTTIGERAFIGVDTMLVAPAHDRRPGQDRRRRRGHPRRARPTRWPSACPPGSGELRTRAAGPRRRASDPRGRVRRTTGRPTSPER